MAKQKLKKELEAEVADLSAKLTSALADVGRLQQEVNDMKTRVGSVPALLTDLVRHQTVSADLIFQVLNILGQKGGGDVRADA